MRKVVYVAGAMALMLTGFSIWGTQLDSTLNAQEPLGCKIAISVGEEVFGGSIGWSSSFGRIGLTETNDKCRSQKYSLVAETSSGEKLARIAINQLDSTASHSFRDIQLRSLVPTRDNSAYLNWAEACIGNNVENIYLILMENGNEIASKKTAFTVNSCQPEFESVSLTGIDEN
jgi:hypothetical protein